MKKNYSISIYLLYLLFSVLSMNSMYSQTSKRIVIDSPTQFDMIKMKDVGIELSCGAIHDGDLLRLELPPYELESLDQLGISYSVEIDDLTAFYKERALEDMPKAKAALALEKANAQNNTARSLSNVTLDNYLQYEGCDEVSWVTPANFNLGSMGGCLTVGEVNAELDQMRSLYPNIISEKKNASPTGQLTYGNSLSSGANNWAGQAINYVRITGDQNTPEGSKPQILYTSMIHSREVSALMSNIFFMWYLLENYATDPIVKNLVDNNELYFIPIVNPDGLRWNQAIAPNGGGLQRKNLRVNPGESGNAVANNSFRGVDLNRNFDYFWGSAGSGSSGTPSSDTYRGPSAFSEPESQILRDFVLARDFKTCTMNHSFANGVPHPYGGNPSVSSGREDEMHKWHEDMTKYNRFVYGATIFTPANGITDDWLVGGAADANGSVGSGRNILATTPELGRTGFWPAPSDIVPIAKNAMRIYFMNAYYGGQYARLHDLTQSDINSTTTNLSFGIERLGQTQGDVTLTVTPVSGNITSITSPATQTGMTILEQRNVTAALILDSGIVPNEKIEYNVKLSNADNVVFYDANIEKYYQPTQLLADDPDTNALTNWTASGGWVTTTSDAYSGTTAIKDGNAIPYANNATSTLTTVSTFDLSNASETIVQFYTQWDLERNFDFVELQGSTDGAIWSSLCGKYNKPNATSNTNDAHSGKSSASHAFQANNSSGRVYDGDQMDKWVMEEIVIDATNNSFLLNATNARFRFRFRSDAGNRPESYSTTYEGFYIDDFKIISVQEPCVTAVPTGFVSTNVAATSVDLSWNTVTSATFDLRYREIGTTVWTTTAVSGTSFIISGLNPSTQYETQLRSKCSDTNTSSYTTSVSFTTTALPACDGINSFPYVESFETGLGVWTNATGDDIEWTRDSEGTPSNGTGPSTGQDGSFYLFTEASTNVTPAGNPGKIALLNSPCIDLSATADYVLAFGYHMFGTSVGNMEVLVSTDGGASYTSIWSQTGNQGDVWNQATINLNAYVGSVIRLQFKGTTGTSWSSDLAIDNINITATAPDTQAPSAPANLVATNITQSTVDLSWTASTDNVGVTAYDIFQGENLVATTTATSFTVAALAPTTSYTFSVRAKDVVGNTSASSNTLSVTTTAAPACDGINSFPYTESFETGFGIWTNATGDDIEWTRDSGGTPSNGTGPTTGQNGSFYLFTEASTNVTPAGSPTKVAILNSPCIDLTTISAGSLAFGYHMMGTSMGTMEVLASTDDGANYTSIWSRTGSQGDAWNQATISLDTYAGTVIRLQFRGTTGTSWSSDMALDNINITVSVSDTVAPTAPANLIAANVTETTVDLSWAASTDNIGVTGYDVYQGTTLLTTVLGTTFNVTGLTAGTTYDFSVQAKDAAGNVSAVSNAVNVTTVTPDTQAPTAPTNLLASNLTQNAVSLSWEASTDNTAVVGYDVYQGTNLLATVSVLNYQVTGLLANTAYSFSVRAKDAAGNISTISNAVNVTTPDTEAPTAPLNLIATSVAETTVNLIWDASVDNVGVTAYDVYQGSTLLTTITGTVYNVTGLIANTSYSFSVFAKDAAGNTSTTSNVLNVTTLSEPDVEAPTAPLNLIASSLTQNSLSLNWEASSDNIGVTSYDVFQGTSLLATVSVLNYSVSGLSASTAYSFSVRAKDAAGNVSPSSNVVNIITPDSEAPTAPGSLIALNETQTTVDLSWNASTDNVGVTAYDVYQGTALITSTVANNYSVTGLTASTSYSFSVRARDAAGNESIASNTLTVTTQSPPDTEAPTAPASLTASNVTQTTADLSWIASTDNVGVTAYDVYQGTTLLSTITGTGYTVTGLIASTSYTFSVLAKDAAGNTSVSSNVVNVTTLDNNVSYCASGATDSSFEFIDFVSLGGINNTTGANGGYADFTNQIGNVSYGSNTIVLSVGFSGNSFTEFWRVWIDYNRDGSFDSSEEAVAGSTSNTGNLSYNFTVPASALSGNTRMRVSLQWNAAPTACQTFQYGEVEDYTVNIGGASTARIGNFVQIDGALTDEASIYDFAVYPNPVIGSTINVKLVDERKATYKVYNSLGQTVLMGNVSRNAIEVGQLSSGVYILEVDDSQRSISKKFIKK